MGGLTLSKSVTDAITQSVKKSLLGLLGDDDLWSTIDAEIVNGVKAGTYFEFGEERVRLVVTAGWDAVIAIENFEIYVDDEHDKSGQIAGIEKLIERLQAAKALLAQAEHD